MTVDRTLIEAVVAARQTAHELKAKVKAAEEVFKTQNDALLEDRAFAEAQLAEAEDALRAAAVAEYERTENKTPGPGISIRVEKALDYDEGDAFDWAREHAAIYLSLRVGAFERFARSQPEMVPFVAITEEPKATIATDLAAALDKEKGA